MRIFSKHCKPVCYTVDILNWKKKTIASILHEICIITNICRNNR